MDAFYASIEQLDNPDLRGKPVIVGGTRNRGVVAAASYEVRAFGVRSAMPTKEALRRCPEAICVTPRMSRYKQVSHEVFEIFRSITPMVEGLSLDEAFLDVTDSQTLFGDPIHLANAIKQKIQNKTGLTASVGIGPNKLVAKIASDLNKPDGLCCVQVDQVQTILDPLPASSLWGVGKTTARALSQQKIETMKDLRLAPDNLLMPVFGRFTESIRRRAAGIDDRKVVSDRPDKSISNEETYEYDIGDVDKLMARLLWLTEKTCARLREKNLAATVVTLKLRDGNFVTKTRQKSFQPASDETQMIFRMAKELLVRWVDENPGIKLRLLGAGVSGLCAAEQLSLFGSDVPIIDRTVDQITQRYGTGTVKRGRILGSSDQS